jgi:hypothetical protein
MKLWMMTALLVGLTTFVGCSSKEEEKETAATTTATAETPTFTLAWSEYPSWSAFGVASEKGLIDGAEGKLGALERKHNVDIVLREADYDTCIKLQLRMRASEPEDRKYQHLEVVAVLHPT